MSTIPVSTPVSTRVSSPSFQALGVPDPLVRVLAEQGITEPFPIQSATLPDSLAGRDVLGRGRTGSGKTFAFVLPAAGPTARAASRKPPGRPRALVLAPDPRAGHADQRGHSPRWPRPWACARTTVFGGVGAGPQISACATASTSSSPAPAGSPTTRQRTPTSTPSRSPCSTRPTTWPTSDSCPSSSACSTRPRDAASACCSRPRSTRGVDVLVQRYLPDPVTHSVDPASRRRRDGPPRAARGNDPRSR